MYYKSHSNSKILYSFFLVALIIEIVSGTIGGSPSSMEYFGGKQYASDQIIVKFHPGAISFPEWKTRVDVTEVKSATDVSELFLASNTLAIKKVFPSFMETDSIRVLKSGNRISIRNFAFHRVFILELEPGTDVLSAVEIFGSSPRVIYAEPDYIYRAAATPWDPYFRNGDQWALEQASDEDIDATSAWDVGIGDYSIKLAILDTGIDYNHLDLGGDFGPGEKVSEGWDYVNWNSDPMDDNFHGTHVAGIAGALTKNFVRNPIGPDYDRGVGFGSGVGIAGVAGGWGYNHQTGSGNMGVQLIAVKVLDASGGGNSGVIANGIVDVADPQGSYAADILNCSIQSWNHSTTMRSAVLFVADVGAVLIACKGNSNSTSPNYPSDYHNGLFTISVGATDIGGDRCVSPAWPYGGSNMGNGIDVVAPGDDIISTMPTYVTSAMAEEGFTAHYQEIWGTSMAAPHVSGLAALLLSEKPWLHRDDVEQIIRLSADRKPEWPPEYDDEHGYGRINAGAAMAYMTAPWSFDHYTIQGGTELNSCWETITYDQIDGYGPISNSGPFVVRLHELRATVNFPTQYSQTPLLWHRSLGSTKGWSDANPNQQLLWCGGSPTTSSVELRTFVHEVYELGGDFVGWFPCEPDDVVFACSVLGIPSIALPDGGDGPVTAVANGTMGPPQEYALGLNEPNPFDTETRIHFQMPEHGHVSIRVYDIRGNEMVTLVDDRFDAGYHEVVWEPAGMPSGVYVCRMVSAEFSATRRVILAR